MDVSITAGAISAAYGLAYLGTARALYHHWREESAKKSAYRLVCNFHTTGLAKNTYYRDDCCFNNDANKSVAPNGLLAFWAIVAAWFWPVAVLVWVVRWSPPLTSVEVEEMERKMIQDRVKLERELGLDKDG